MPIKVLDLHHYAIHMSPAVMDKTTEFYRNVFAAKPYAKRPDIGHGAWIDMPCNVQIHILGEDGPSRFAKGPDKDPVHPHTAYAVEDITTAMAELTHMNVEYWTLNSEVLPQLTQVFFRDPAGNLIELHQDGYCHCRKNNRP